MQKFSTILLALMVIIAGIPISPAPAAEDTDTAKNQQVLDKVDKFLSAASPAYRIEKSAGKLTVDFCNNNKSCQDAIPKTKKDLAGLGLEMTVDFVSTIASDPDFVDRAAIAFFQKYGRVLSGVAKTGLKKLSRIAKWGSIISTVSTVSTVSTGVWDTSKQVQAGDYEAATKTALKTALKIGANILAGTMATAICGAAALATLGVGGLICVAAVATVGGAALDMLANMIGDATGDAAGGLLYAAGGLLYGLVVDTNNPTTPQVSSRPSNAPHQTGGVRAGKGVNDNSRNIKTKGLKSIVHLDGSIVTLAPRGENAVTQIGSAISETNKARGTYTTEIDGMVYNKGGLLEINPIKGCATKRNGKCCIQIHRTYCVTDKYKLSKRKRKCAKGYERQGRYCYRYADKQHSVSK